MPDAMLEVMIIIFAVIFVVSGITPEDAKHLDDDDRDAL